MQSCAERHLVDVPRFDFISGPEFATSLTADQKEFESCLECGAWKAAVVLAGSIVEAVLVDYLLSLSYTGKGKPNALKMDLSEVISTCYKEKILTEKAKDLSSVIRQYRNLIHPGRAVRLEEAVGQPEARSAQALLDIIIAEVVKHREKTYGYTAEQIVAKLERDSSSLAILPQILEETRDTEMERLLIDVIPREYFAAEEDALDFGVYQRSLRDCFRLVFDKADVLIKKKAVGELVRVIRGSDQKTVYSFEEAFFLGSDLEYLSESDCRLVKAHILARLKTDKGTKFLLAIKEIGRFLRTDEEIREFVWALAPEAAKGVAAAKDRLEEESFRVEDKLARSAILPGLRTWAKFYSEKGQPFEDHAKRLATLATTIEQVLDLPF